jgi:hypothetical protein
VRSWLGDTVAGSNAITRALDAMKVVPAIAEGKDIRMTSPIPPHNSRFELEDRTARSAAGTRKFRLLVPTRQALTEAVEGRAANSLLTTRSDTGVPDPFFFNPGFLSEYLSTTPTPTSVAGTYNVQRPYSEEFGYFSSDAMFASAYTRYMLPAPDAKEGVLPGFGIYELVSGFAMLLHTCFDFFEQHCVDVDLDTVGPRDALGPLLFITKLAHEEDSPEDAMLFVEAVHCHTVERAQGRFQQFRERGVGDARVARIRLSRWNFYDTMLKGLSQVVPFQKRNQATALTRQIMRLITQEKHAMQTTRHVRALCAEIKSLANKMEVLHIGKDTVGEPLFGGQDPVPYTVQGVGEAFQRGTARSSAAQGVPAAPLRKGFARGFVKGWPEPEPQEDAQATVSRLFRDQMLAPEVEQALSDLIVRGKFLRETSAFIEEPPLGAPVPVQAHKRGTRILSLIFESAYDWTPILRRIAGYIHTPAFDRLYLPVIVQTQVPHQTRAQRKVGSFDFIA